jgi:hypothetical protein
MIAPAVEASDLASDSAVVGCEEGLESTTGAATGVDAVGAE